MCLFSVRRSKATANFHITETVSPSKRCKEFVTLQQKVLCTADAYHVSLSVMLFQTCLQ